MLTTYLRQIYRDRRRILVASLLNLAATGVAGDALPDPLPVATEMLVGGAFILSVPLISIHARTWRHWVEIVALANLIGTSVGALAPGSVFAFHGLGGWFVLNLLAHGALIVGLHGLIYGHWSDVFARPVTLSAATRRRSRAELRALWYGLVATPGHLNQYPDPEIVSVDYTDAAHRTVRLLRWSPGRGREVALVHHDEIEPLRYVRLRYQVIEGLSDPAAEGTTELAFRDLGAEREVILRHHGGQIAPRRMIRAWLDDTLGRMLDSQVAAIEAGVCHASGRVARHGYDAFYDRPEKVGTARDDIAGAYRTAYGRELSARERALLEAGSRRPGG